MVFTLRWGILATGWIAEKFTIDLLIDPATRKTHDVAHVVAAIASSSSKEKAEAFKKHVRAPEACACYGSYDAFVKDANIDIVYVASPHSHHFEHTLLALNAGKHVVCEKPITVNAAQAKILYSTAKEKGLFLLDAVWTRYFPLSIQIRDIIKSGEIGDVLRVFADTSMGEDMDDLWHVQKRRKVNLDLAGGALLEIGIYCLTWIFQTLYHTLVPSCRAPPTVTATHMTKYAPTGVDETTSFILSFPSASARPAIGIGTTSFPLASDPDARGSAGPSIRIQGTKGEVAVYGMAFQPERYKVIPIRTGDEVVAVREVHCPFPAGGHGMYYEADEAARCVRDGKLESETMGWEESVAVMEVMDEIRRLGGLRYPDAIESTQH